MFISPLFSFFFFFNDTATTEIYTLSLHDALPISLQPSPRSDLYEVEIVYEIPCRPHIQVVTPRLTTWGDLKDRKSTRLNSSHSQISYAVFCLKKKKKKYNNDELWSTTRIARSSTQ